MAFTTWFTFFIAALILCVSPGPGALSSISAGLRYGWVRGMWNCLGLQAATVVNVFIIWLGLGALLMTSAFAFEVMKYAGALYLIWLGIQKFREPPVSFDEIASRTEFRDVSPFGIFRRGFFVNLTNPKGLVFLLAVLPQFIDPAKPTAMQYVILTLTLTMIDLLVMACYTALAARVLRVLKDPQHLRWTNRALGGLFIAAGGALAIFKRS